MMRTLLQRLTEYARLAWWMASYSLLAAFWLVLLNAFYDHMAPRLSYLTAHRAIANDLPCAKPECDFSVFWPAGRLARAHDFITLYTPQAFVRTASAMLLPGSRLETFFYPPHMLLPAAFISYLPFEIASFVWAFGMLLLAIIVLRMARLPWLVVAAGVLSPAALLDLETDQIGLLGGALLVAGLMLSAERPRIAGGLLGLLSFKPQIGLLAPIILLAQRNWRALVFFILVAAILTALVSLWFGQNVWTAYFTLGQKEATRVLDLPFNPATNQGWGISVFWMFRSFHAGLTASFVAQAVAILIAAATILWLARRPDISRPAFVEIAVLLSLLAMPYGYTEDMVAFSLVLAASAKRNSWRIGMLDTLFWLWPGFCLVVSEKTGLLLTPMVICAALARSLRRAGLGAAHLPPVAPVLPRAG